MVLGLSARYEDALLAGADLLRDRREVSAGLCASIQLLRHMRSRVRASVSGGDAEENIDARACDVSLNSRHARGTTERLATHPPACYNKVARQRRSDVRAPGRVRRRHRGIGGRVHVLKGTRSRVHGSNGRSAERGRLEPYIHSAVEPVVLAALDVLYARFARARRCDGSSCRRLESCCVREWARLIYLSLAIGRAQNCLPILLAPAMALTSSEPWLREWATPTWRQRSG